MSPRVMPLGGNKEDLIMTIYEFIETVNEGSDIIYTLFDYNTEEVIFMATDEAENTCEFNRDDLLYSEYSDYEIGSMDMWIDKGRIHIEFNIEVEENEEDEDYEI
jgi:hypothetical protein